MSLRFDIDPRTANWVVAGLPGGLDPALTRRLVIGPDGFEAYARVLALPDPLHPGQSENDAGELSTDLSDAELISGVVDLLTDTADDVELLFLLWEGWPYRPSLPRGRRIDLAGIREYALAAGTLRDWLDWRDAGDRGYAPGFVWPADRSWCITYDTDSHFAGVGGTAAAIDRLLADPQLTVVAQTPGEIPPMYQ